MAYKVRKIELLTILIFGGMVLLLPVITANALAFTAATVKSLYPFAGCCVLRFSDAPRWHIDSCGDSGCGDFVVTPTKLGDFNIIWSTIGTATIFGGGTEKGFVDADFNVGTTAGTVRFFFNNPSSGPNTCNVEFIKTVPVKLGSSCDITPRGDTAELKYLVCAGDVVGRSGGC